jgi:hypothetical protein
VRLPTLVDALRDGALNESQTVVWELRMAILAL